jgi:DNA-binding beta-propeller fold protein YncE
MEAQIDRITKGSVWFNTSYPITLENINDKIVVFMIWDANDPIALEQVHQLMNASKNLFQIQLISAVQAQAGSPQPRREYYSLIQRENLEHPLVVCPDFKDFKAPQFTGPLQVRLYGRPGGQALHIFEGPSIVKDVLQEIQTLSESAELKGKLRYWQMKDSVETHYWADANIEFPTHISTYKSNGYLITETNHHRIHHVSADGKIVKIIGAPQPGFADGNFLSAQFNCPKGTSHDNEQDLIYIADCFNHRIRAVDMASQLVFTVAGNGKDFAELTSATNGGYEAFGFPVDIAIDNNKIFVLSASHNQVFLLDPISGGSREVVRLPLNNKLNQRIFPEQLEIQGKIGFVTMSDGTAWQIEFKEKRKFTDAVTQKEVEYEYGYCQPVAGSESIRWSGMQMAGKKLIGISKEGNSIWEIKKGKLRLIAGGEMEGWKDGKGKEASFHSPTDFIIYDQFAYVLDQNNESLRSVQLKNGKVTTVPFIATDALAFGGNVVPQGENIVFEDIAVGEGPVEVTFQLDLGEYEFRNDGVNIVMLIDDAMGVMDSEIITDGVMKAKVNPKDLLYGTLQLEMTFSVSHPLRPTVVLRKQCMVTAMLSVIPGEPTNPTLTWKPHILPF